MIHPRNKRALITRQPQHRIRNILRRGQPPKRNLKQLRSLPSPFLGILKRRHKVISQLRRHQDRTHSIAPDTLRPELVRQGLRRVRHGRLGRVVPDQLPAGPQGRDGRDIDDRPAG